MKSVAEKIKKTCSVCEKKIKIILYKDKSYRGGHYFGEIPIYSKKEWQKAIKAGARKSRIGKMQINVLKRDPKPSRYVEYWECPRCYK